MTLSITLTIALVLGMVISSTVAHEDHEVDPLSEDLSNDPADKAESSSSIAPYDIVDHNLLTTRLLDEKKRFEQKYLDCDETLKKIIHDADAAIQEHKHDEATAFLDQMKAYKVDEALSPCEKSENLPETPSEGEQPKSKTNGGERNTGVFFSVMLVFIHLFAR